MRADPSLKDNSRAFASGSTLLSTHMSSPNQTYVAVVDDDESVCQSFGRLLRAAGLHPVTYSSAEAFLADMKQPRFDCLCWTSSSVACPALNWRSSSSGRCTSPLSSSSLRTTIPPPAPKPKPPVARPIFKRRLGHRRARSHPPRGCMRRKNFPNKKTTNPRPTMPTQSAKTSKSAISTLP